MSEPFVSYAGRSNVGFKQKVNEDFIICNSTDFGEDMVFASIADGAGAKDSLFRPASLASSQAESVLKRFCKKNKDMFENNLRLFLEQALYIANDVLIAFKIGDEEERMQYASTLTAAMLKRDGTLIYAHTGNTRLYIVRDGKVIQMTKDQTVGQRMIDQGKLDKANYYTAVERLQLYSGLGMFVSPEVETKQFKLNKNDIVVLTSDGIHYSYPSESIYEILRQSGTADDAAEALVQNALDVRIYPDNISAIVLWYLGDGE